MKQSMIALWNSVPEKQKTWFKNTFYYNPAIRKHHFRAENPDYFHAVFFEVVTRCNSRCDFCSASIQNDTRPKQEMSFEVYEKAIQGLKEINYAGRVAYHVNNDPLLFPHLDEFIQHARKELPNCYIQIMTNGILLTAERGQQLVDLGVDSIHIDFYRKERNQQLFKGIREFQEQVLDTQFPVKQGISRVSKDGARRVDFQIEWRYLTEVLYSRGGSSPNKTPFTPDITGFCIHPFTQFNVTADGRVAKCCADFHFSDPMGYVQETSVKDIWFGEKFTHVRTHLIKGNRRALENCRQCDYFGLPNKYIVNPLMKAIKYNLLAPK